MSNLKLIVAAAAALFVAAPAFADHDEGHGKHHKKHHDESGDRDDDHDRGRDDEGRRFSDHDRDEISRYYNANPRRLGPDEDDEDERLPPGLAKKHKIPPGWRKKLARGERIPDDVWEHRVELPKEVVVNMPVPPPGVVLIRIHNQVVRAVEQTHEVLDVLGLPHPPTPPKIEKR